VGALARATDAYVLAIDRLPTTAAALASTCAWLSDALSSAGGYASLLTAKPDQVLDKLPTLAAVMPPRRQPLWNACATPQRAPRQRAAVVAQGAGRDRERRGQWTTAALVQLQWKSRKLTGKIEDHTQALLPQAAGGAAIVGQNVIPTTARIQDDKDFQAAVQWCESGVTVFALAQRVLRTKSVELYAIMQDVLRALKTQHPAVIAVNQVASHVPKVLANDFAANTAGAKDRNAYRFRLSDTDARRLMTKIPDTVLAMARATVHSPHRTLPQWAISQTTTSSYSRCQRRRKCPGRFN